MPDNIEEPPTTSAGVDNRPTQASSAPRPPTLGRIGRGYVALASVLGTIWILLQVVGFFQSDFDLEATGEYAQFEVPTEFPEQLARLRDYELRSVAYKLLRAEAANVTSRPASSAADKREWVAAMENDAATADKIAAWLTERSPAELEGFLRYSRATVWIEVENKGRKEVTGLELQVPRGTGFFVVHRPGQAEQLARFDSAMQLGSLKPGTSLAVTLWSAYPVERWNAGDVRLIHANGTASVGFRAHVGWPIASIVHSPVLYAILVVFGFPIVGFLVIWLCICLVDVGRRLSGKASADEVKTPD